MSNKAVTRLHNDISRLNKAKDAHHHASTELHKDSKALKTSQKHVKHDRDQYDKQNKKLGTERSNLADIQKMEKMLLSPLDLEEQKLQAAYDASVDPTTGQGDATIQAQLDACNQLEADLKGTIDGQIATQQQKVDALKASVQKNRVALKSDQAAVKHGKAEVKHDKSSVAKTEKRVKADRKKAFKDLRPAEYKMSLKATNKARQALGLSKVKHVIRPDAGLGKVVDLAKHYLGKYETQLQAAGVTLPCPTSESCANFVTSMLHKAGKINFRTLSVSTLNADLRARGWHTVSLANAKPGDVWICNGAHGESHTEIVASNHNGHVTLIGSNNHPISSNQQINYDTYSANISGSFILAPPN